MTRPKFTLASLLMLTTIVAMAAVIYRHRVQIEHLKTQLAAKEAHLAAVRAQVLKIGGRQLELQVASHELHLHLELNGYYAFSGAGDALRRRLGETLMRDAAPEGQDETDWSSDFTYAEFNLPVEYRRAVSRVQQMQNRLARDQAVLAQLVQQKPANSK